MLMLLAGCADARLFQGPPVATLPAVPEPPHGETAYRVGCADVLEVRFAERSAWDCLASVSLDGRLPLGAAGTPLVEGATLDEVRTAIAKQTELTPASIQVRLAEARAARLYLHGPENNQVRIVPYRGPERVVDFLWRVGAVKQGCSDLHDVHVLRPNVATGGEPRLFKVNIDAVTFDGDQMTNVLLRPSDQVYVGETRRSSFSRLLPEWLKPLYRKLVGLLPPDGWPWVPKT
jgi:protein involved in polysaccharide export with SLBB domain